jgi:hypothetical protein
MLAVILLAGLAFRLLVARYLANDDPDDGRVYAQLAVNLVDHTTFSDDEEAPFEPTLIRVPGYPIFLSAIYLFAGNDNNGAVRTVQALIDTATCAMIGGLAFLWMPDPRRRWRAGLVAAGFAAVCPFTAIYVATILSETVAVFLLVALTLTVTLGLKSSTTRSAVGWWIASGLLAGAGVMVRPDLGLAVAAAGVALVLIGLFSRPEAAEETAAVAAPRARLVRVVMLGAVFSAAFVLVLLPWTVRNHRVFGVFQPLSPAHAEMPGEFVSRGYFRWLRTWVDDERYIEPAIWALDDEPITVDKLPAKAFDSPEEKARVAALLDQYNHPPAAAPTPAVTGGQPSAPTELPIPGAPPTTATPAPSPNANGNANSADDSDEGSDADDEGDEEDKGDEASGDEAATEKHQTVEMTPAIDAGFAALAQERISRAPVRYYVWMPVKRGFALWFGTHSQYYPFAGELFPWSELDTHQKIWLPIFVLLVALYTIVGKFGGWVLLLWRREGRKWVLLVALMTIPRLIFFATIENPEPRYVVELFAFCSILAGIAVAFFLPPKEPAAVEEKASE